MLTRHYRTENPSGMRGHEHLFDECKHEPVCDAMCGATTAKPSSLRKLTTYRKEPSGR